ncbi:MAG: hypothetical protein ACREXR_01975 [Gammaproteobacteria bacterium]
MSAANGLNRMLGRATDLRRQHNVSAQRCWMCGLEHTRAGFQVEELEDASKREPVWQVKM